ncbi:ADP-ribosylglycohydrolase family protein [Micropruina sp.]|uniref:ADP-ribosylglycohydrolase family protein n=1 Tax=Micropruina sp. TaxID=2737536 RepID=UPI0039E2DCFB
MASLTSMQLDRAVGAIVASAAGDALGSAYEFGPGLSDTETPEFGRGVFGHAPGEWTDDTAMAMPILDALADGHSLLDPATLATIVARWREWSATAKDVGVQTRSVLGQLGDDCSEAVVREAAWAVHERSGRSAGNGSLMRTGPVALGFLAEGSEAVLAEAAGRIAQLTHYEQDNVDAVVLWSLAIRHAILTGEFDPKVGLEWVGHVRSGGGGVSTSSTSGGGVSTSSTGGGRDRWERLIDEAMGPGAHPRDFKDKNGWVVAAFQGALAAVAGASGVRDALIRAVRGGGDTDTVAAIAGSLAGAIWGAAQVPLSWQRVLHGWPGCRTNDLTRLAIQAARGGRADSAG